MRCVLNEKEHSPALELLIQLAQGPFRECQHDLSCDVINNHTETRISADTIFEFRQFQSQTRSQKV